MKRRGSCAGAKSSQTHMISEHSCSPPHMRTLSIGSINSIGTRMALEEEKKETPSEIAPSSNQSVDSSTNPPSSTSDRRKNASSLTNDKKSDIIFKAVKLPHDDLLFRTLYRGHPHYKKGAAFAKNQFQQRSLLSKRQLNEELSKAPEPMPSNWFHKICWWIRWKIVVTKWFDGFIIAMILVNCFFISLNSPPREKSHWTNRLSEEAEPYFAAIFLMEMVLKFIGLGFIRRTRDTKGLDEDYYEKLPDGYFRSTWNIMDFCIVVLSLVALLSAGSAKIAFLRLIRVFRPLRAVNRWKSLKLIVNTMLTSIVAVGRIIIFMTTMVFVFSVMGVRLFQGVLHQRCYDDVTGMTEQERNGTMRVIVVIEEDGCNGRGHLTKSVPCAAGDLLDDGERICTFSSGLYKCPSGFTCRADEANPNFGLMSFDIVYNAAFQVFQSIQGEGNFDILYNLQDGYSPWSWIYFALIFILLTVVSMNILMAAIEDSYKNEKETDRSFLELSANMDKEERDRYIWTLYYGIQWLQKEVERSALEANKQFLERFPDARTNELPLKSAMYRESINELRKKFLYAKSRLQNFRDSERKAEEKQLPTTVIPTTAAESARGGAGSSPGGKEAIELRRLRSDGTSENSRIPLQIHNARFSLDNEITHKIFTFHPWANITPEAEEKRKARKEREDRAAKKAEKRGEEKHDTAADSKHSSGVSSQGSSGGGEEKELSLGKEKTEMQRKMTDQKTLSEGKEAAAGAAGAADSISCAAPASSSSSSSNEEKAMKGGGSSNKTLFADCDVDLDAARISWLALDLDGDGYLSREEVSEFLTKMGKIPTSKELDAMFARADLDKNGKIGFKEFAVTVGGVPPKMVHNAGLEMNPLHRMQTRGFEEEEEKLLESEDEEEEEEEEDGDAKGGKGAHDVDDFGGSDEEEEEIPVMLHQRLRQEYVNRTTDVDRRRTAEVMNRLGMIMERKSKNRDYARRMRVNVAKSYIGSIQRTVKMSYFATNAFLRFRETCSVHAQRMDYMIRAIHRAYTYHRDMVTYLQEKPSWVVMVHLIVINPLFDIIFLVIIVFNAAVQAVDRFHLPEHEEDLIHVTNSVCLWLAVVECTMRMIGLGPKLFLSDVYNHLDMVLVPVALIAEIFYYSSSGGRVEELQWVLAFRTMRVFRISKLMTSLRGLRVLQNVIAQTVHDVWSILIITIIVLFMLSILGVQLFGGSFSRVDEETRWSFADTYQAFLVVFMCITGDSWPDASAQAMSVTNNWAPLYFCLVIVFGDMIVMNLFIAVLLQGFDIEDGGLMELEDFTEIARDAFVSSDEMSKVSEDENPFGENTLLLVASIDAHIKEREKEVKKSAEAAQELVNTRVMAQKLSITLRSRPNENFWLRAVACTVVTSSLYRNMMLFIVLVDCVVIAMRVSMDKESVALLALHIVFLLFYSLETVLKFIAYRKKFFKHWDYVLDALLVVVGLFHFGFPDADAISFLYAFRPLRVLTRTASTKVILESTFSVMPKIYSTLFMLFILLFSFAVFFVAVFKGSFFVCSDDAYSDEDACVAAGNSWQRIHFARNFDNVANALVTLFQVSTLTTWNEVMYDCIDAVGPGKAPRKNNQPVWGIVFFIFVMLSAFIGFNIFVGVLVSEFKDQMILRGGTALLTKGQRGWLNAQKYILHLMELPIQLPGVPDKWYRRGPFYIVGQPTDNHHPFNYFIMVMVMLNALFLCLIWYEMPPMVEYVVFVANLLIFTVVFTLEMVLKISAWSLKVYLRDPWNRFDGTIVLLSIIGLAVAELNSVALVFRTLRVFRLFMLVRKMPILSQFSQVFVLSLPAIFQALSVVFIIVFIFAVAATILFKKVAFWDGGLSIRANFQNFPNSMLSLFRVAVGDAWEELMYGCMITEETGVCEEEKGLTLAVMMDAFDKYNERDRVYNTLIKWRELWTKYDPKGYGILPPSRVMSIIRAAPKPLGFNNEPMTTRQIVAALKAFDCRLEKVKLSKKRYLKLYNGKPPRRFQREISKHRKLSQRQSMLGVLWDDRSTASEMHGHGGEGGGGGGGGEGKKWRTIGAEGKNLSRQERRRCDDEDDEDGGGGDDDEEVDERARTFPKESPALPPSSGQTPANGLSKVGLVMWYSANKIADRFYRFLEKSGRLGNTAKHQGAVYDRRWSTLMRKQKRGRRRQQAADYSHSGGRGEGRRQAAHCCC
eukprot:jgi/Bigna1/90435/estExt_fgenesh1_pg.C_700070